MFYYNNLLHLEMLLLRIKFAGNILEYNSIYYRIGVGHKEFIPDKAMDEEYYLLTLMAIARELNVFSIREADVHLAAGLPLTWIRNQREAFRSYLLQNPEVHYRFNGKEYHLRFAGCSLYPQGYPAIVNQLGNFKGTNLLADIGNGTMNILYIIPESSFLRLSDWGPSPDTRRKHRRPRHHAPN